jgi:hypothetical protein
MEMEWKEIERDFDKWNFPGCYGATDGKHTLQYMPQQTVEVLFIITRKVTA